MLRRTYSSCVPASRNFFGDESVFLDIEQIEPGADVAEHIERHLQSCKVLLVAVGPVWNEPTAEGVRCLDRENDFVRMELASALKRQDVRVIPLLLDGAEMPRANDLPEELERFARCNAFEIDTRRNFSAVVKALIEVLTRWLSHTPDATLPKTKVSQSSTAHPNPKWAVATGADEHGRWADVCYSGVLQRLRFIEPGQFFMGAGKRDVGRRANEGPSHPVALYTGFWLADTACTQELWYAVMKQRPSFFEDRGDHPIERVSWNDVVHRFLPVLQRQWQAHAALPTEAEWEYACRAGSTVACAWGNDLGEKDANVERGSSESLPSGRGSTCAVKQHRANAFGPYGMHGNVWEWCDDDLRTYESALATDPHGGHGGPRRAVRGGSWNNNAARSRSACRRSLERDFCRPFVGFRFKLMSR